MDETVAGNKDCTLLQGDSLTILKSLPDCSVNCCITSPPYYGLRDYDKEGQIGKEKTPKQYIDRLVCVFQEVKRVLAEDGTAWINIGDSYVTAKGEKNPKEYKTKDLLGIPWMLAFALRENGWYLRQDIIWQKTNCMPESVRDRCTKSHEHIFLLTKNPTYYFDAEAIAEPVSESTIKRLAQNITDQKGSNRQPGKTNGAMKACKSRFSDVKYVEGQTKSGNEHYEKPLRNKRDVWSVSTSGFKGAHFATFPTKLVEPMVFAGCPENGTVLDPFAGSGTVGVVALNNKRKFIGIDLNESYLDIAKERIRKEVSMQGGGGAERRDSITKPYHRNTL